MKLIFDILMYIPLYIIGLTNRLISNVINLYFKLIKEEEDNNIISEYQKLYTLDSDGNVDLNKILVEPDDCVETEYDIELTNEILNAYSNHIAEINREKERIRLEEEKKKELILLEKKNWESKYKNYTPVVLKNIKYDISRYPLKKQRIEKYFKNTTSSYIERSFSKSLIYDGNRIDIFNEHDVPYNISLFPDIILQSTFSIRNSIHNKCEYIKYKNALNNYTLLEQRVYFTLDDLIKDNILEEIAEKLIEIKNESDKKIKHSKSNLEIKNYNFIICVNCNKKTKKHITSIKWEQKLMLDDYSETLSKELMYNIRD